MTACSCSSGVQADGEEMLRASLTLEGIRVEVFASEGSEHPCQDRWVVHPFGERVRIAAIDGSTPWHAAPAPGADAAAFAAATVAGMLLLPVPARESLLLANRALHDPAVLPARRQAMATACVVDAAIARRGLDCRGLVASDCEWWVSNGESDMRLLVGGEARKPSALRAARERLDAEPLPDDGVEALRQREAEDYDDPEAWHSHAVGRVAAPRFLAGEGVFERIVIASDGALLSESPRSADSDVLQEWLASVEAREYRDDFTVLLVAPA